MNAGYKKGRHVFFLKPNFTHILEERNISIVAELKFTAHT